MVISGLDHIGIPVSDMEKSCEFYEKLGFTKAAEFTMGRGHVFRFYRAGDLLIELIPREETARINGAVDHFAIRCDNCEEAFAFCREQGFPLLNDSVLKIGFWENGMKCFNIEGPDKEKIEFVELL